MSSHGAPARWLSFFGQASLIAPGGSEPLACKYRNGILLLGFLAAHPERIFRRESLADLFWPQLDTSAGRSNLRVVLTDLLGVLKAVGLAECLETQREWLSFHLPENLWSDESLLTALRAGETRGKPWLGFMRERLASDPPWLDIGDARTSEDFREWLGVQRIHLENLFPPAVDAPAPAAAPVAADSPLELAILALLRLDLEPLQEIGDEREVWRRMQADEARLVREAAIHGGVLVDSGIDGATFAFGQDSLHGGYRWQSLRAAANLHAVLAPRYRVRMGVLAGRVLIERGSAPRASGMRVRLVEQLAMSAQPGEIVADESYLDLAPAFGGTTRGSRRFRGVTREVELCGQSIEKLPAFLLLPVCDGNAPFVGREATLAELDARWQRVRQGEAQRYCLEGEAGIGKTRAVYEFAARLQAVGTPIFWLGGRSETAGHPWSVLHELLTRLLCGAGADWDERLERFLEQMGRKLGHEQRTALLRFLANHGVVHGERSVFTEAFRILLGDGGRPLLIVVDDAQWVDAASSAVLREIAALAPHAFFLLTRRPVHCAGLLLDGCTTQPLAPLDDGAAYAILDAMPDADLLDRAVHRRIVSSARGLPIYLLAGAAPNGAPLAEHLQGMSNSLDKAVGVMKVAALFGIQFQLDDLFALIPPEIAEAAVGQAAASRLIVSRGPRTWAFFHPLLHSHLRGLLDAPEIRELAPRAAQVLERRGELPQAAALFEEAGAGGLARETYLRAASQALDREDTLAACPLFEHVARLGYGTGDAGQWARLRHARALVIKDGYGSRSVHQISRVVRQSLPALLGGDEIAFKATAYAYLGAGNERADAGLEYAEEMGRLARTPIQLQTAAWARANTLFWLGRFMEARPLLENALATADALPFAERIRYFPSDPLVLGNGQLAWMRWFMGDGAGARACIERAMAHALGSRLRQDKAIAYCFAAVLCWCEGDMAGLAMNANEAWIVADGEDYLLWKTVAGLLLAVARATGGEAPKLLDLLAAENVMRQAYPGGLNTGRWIGIAALLAAGQNFIALQVIERALGEGRQQEHQYCLMDIWRLKAQALEALPLSRRASVREAHAQAVRCAQAAGARGWLDRWYPDSFAVLECASELATSA